MLKVDITKDITAILTSVSVRGDYYVKLQKLSAILLLLVHLLILQYFLRN